MKGSKKDIPFRFVLDEIISDDLHIKPMFGSHALYLGEKIILILRKRPEHQDDNGVCIATAIPHHESLRNSLPSMRTIGLFGTEVSAWQNIPEDSERFEEDVLEACRLINKGDPRIGRIPVKKKKGVLVKKPAEMKTVTKKSAKKS